MDCFCEILNALCNSFIFDKLWWKDYGIPLLGTMAIPLLVWFLTWYYGAEKAEERRELRELRDNLNLLLSVCLDALNNLISLRDKLISFLKIEQKKKIDGKDIEDLAKTILSPDGFNAINVANYSSCISYSENYVIDLLKIITGLNIKNFKVEHRNSQLKSISDNQDNVQKFLKFQELMQIELEDFPVFITEIENLIMLLRKFIKETEDLEKKIKGLTLDTVKYSEEQKQLFAELEQKYKEHKND